MERVQVVGSGVAAVILAAVIEGRVLHYAAGQLGTDGYPTSPTEERRDIPCLVCGALYRPDTTQPINAVACGNCVASYGLGEIAARAEGYLSVPLDTPQIDTPPTPPVDTAAEARREQEERIASLRAQLAALEAGL